MVRFHGRQSKVDKEDPTLLASYYIPAVALTRLLASPGWTALALNPVGNTEFVAEVRRIVEPRYVWDPRPHYRYVEPLARTPLLQEREHDATSVGRRGEYDVLELSSRPGEAMNEPYRRS
jgi:hypothetical protein